jgi:hypothetical protein
MDFAGKAQVIGESLWAVEGVEISDLGVNGELQQERHLSVFAGSPDYDSIVVEAA